MLKDMKEMLEKTAQLGLLCTYDDLVAKFNSGRAKIYSALDEINAETRKDECGGHLLSAVVIGEDGLPGPGFFRKLRDGDWSRREVVDNAPVRDIFREELARVYDRWGAPRKILPFIDLENMAASGREVRGGVIDALNAMAKICDDRKNACKLLQHCGFMHAQTGGWPDKCVNHQGKKKAAVSVPCGHCLNCLQQAGSGMKKYRAHPHAAGGTNAADNYLIGEWVSWVIKGAPISPTGVLTRRDIVCIFADDAGYHESVLRAKDKGFEVWGFGDSKIERDKNRGSRGDTKKKAKSRLQNFRTAFEDKFYDLREPRTWNFAS